MKHLRSNIFLKTLAILFHQLFFIVCAVTIFIGITYWNYDDATFDILEQEDFTKTNYYKRLVEEKFYDLTSYVRDCENFQTNNQNDTQRIVDIYDYVQNDRITGNATYSIGYTLHDLLQWQKEGFVYEAVPSPADSSSQSVYSSNQLVEAYQNTAGVSLNDYSQLSQTDYQQLCETLEKAAQKVTESYTAYRNQVSLFKLKNTNLRYAVYNGNSGQLYTNLDISDISDGITRIEALETYATLHTATADFDSSLLYAGDQLNRYLNELYTANENYIITIGVDTSFPVRDTFHKENLRYQTFERWFETLYKLFLISIIGYVLTLLYMSISAGCRRGTDEVSFTFLDRIKLEPLLLILFLGEIIIWKNIIYHISGFSLPSINLLTLIRLCCLSLLASLLFTAGYLSLLRRIKKQALWNTSLLYSLTTLFRRLQSNRHHIIRAVIGYFLVLCSVLLLLLYTRRPLACLLFGCIASILLYFLLRSMYEKQQLLDGTNSITQGNLEYQIDTSCLTGQNQRLGTAINQIRDVLHQAVEDSIKNERLKTNLITNVSHDIKTPLTSIINYVTLLQTVPIEDERARHYIQILDDKSQRLRHLIDDLVEASKISSNNIVLEKAKLNLTELVTQTDGEFYERFEQNNLSLVTRLPEHAVFIEADGRRIWRILENIYSNAIKYSMPGTRVYAQLASTDCHALFTLKNISAQPLNIDTDELTKRFVRGDVSRTTEGNGLGLSIAKDLTTLHGGTLTITTDGDLFCITIQLPLFQADTDH